MYYRIKKKSSTTYIKFILEIFKKLKKKQEKKLVA